MDTHTPEVVAPSLLPLREKFRNRSSCKVTGVFTTSGRAFIILETASTLPAQGVLLWLTPDEKELTKLERLLRLLADLVPNAPPILRLPFPDLAPLAALGRSRCILLATVDQLWSPMPLPETLKRQTLRIAPSDLLSPGKLAQTLSLAGYEYNTEAAGPGIYARHGGVMDVFPLGAENPCRIEFSGQRVADLREIDLETDHTRPVSEALAIIPRSVRESDGTLLDHFDELALWVWYADPDHLGNASPHWIETRKRLKDHPQAVFHSFTRVPQAVDLDYQSPKYYHNDPKQFSNEIAKLPSDWRVILSTAKVRELEGLLRETPHQAHIRYVPLEMTGTGFVSQRDRILFLTEREIFGHVTVAAPAHIRHKVDLSLIAELRPGDFVVHIDHGIARFTGMTVQQVDRIEREYFILEYAENDKLFVPVENADKISKYIGSSHPKLHRLSASNWYQVKARVREDTLELAQELLKLYAQRATVQAPSFGHDTREEKALEASFPYEETPDQLEAIRAVKKDLGATTPMDRLVCGDVGFGKTEVAIRAAFKAVSHGAQVCLLAPTTILTQQHFDTFRERLRGFPARIELLSRFRSDRQQREAIQKLATGEIDIIIGTHRLLSSDIHFRNLGLIVIDEEQRFGVRHKEQLKALRTQAHTLTLTATPIPRTLNFALSGLREISVIETPPEGRLPIQTYIQPVANDLVKQAITQELKRKGQVYYLHNEVESIQLAARHVQKLVPETQIGIAHGQMAEDDLMEAMAAFDTQKTNVLVCSTIIENGLDLPNVNTLIVENATNFGLAQLYQLRGRIGRGKRQAYAYFFYDRKKVVGSASKRLQALLEAKELGSGLQLAIRDLEIRGTGSILGKKQHGHVTAIGLALYSRLLAQAIEEAETGQPVEGDSEVHFDLPIEIGIPKTFVASEPKRLKLYQQMAQLKNREEIDRFRNREFRGEQIPETVKNLLKLLELRSIAQQAKIAQIASARMNFGGLPKERLTITFRGHLVPQHLEKLLGKNPAWEFTQDALKIDREKLSLDWLGELMETLRLFVPKEGSADEKENRTMNKEAKKTPKLAKKKAPVV